MIMFKEAVSKELLELHAESQHPFHSSLDSLMFARGAKKNWQLFNCLNQDKSLFTLKKKTVILF